MGSDALQTSGTTKSSARTANPNPPPSGSQSHNRSQSKGNGASAPESVPRAAHTAGSQTGASTPSAPHPASLAPRSTPEASRSAPRSEALSLQVEHAIKEGDIFFEQGKYDLAIQAYSQPLKIDPTNGRLGARIKRARKAKAAEEEYLGKQ
jgi:tetratricopeptide (TPR) repeat protein